MADDPEFSNVPRATVVPGRRARVSVVWLIPILAAVVAIGIAVQRVLSEGPTITIVFKAAQGLEAGKTFVKYKDVNIGQVTAVRLSDDYTKVVVTAKIVKSAEGLMVEDAKFWVVEPRVTLSGVSGLGTLLSGNYVGFEAGKSSRKSRSFVGIEVPPIVTGDQPGRQFALKADNLGSLGIGSPIYYRRLQAGQIVGYSLAPDGKTVELRIFVNAPYDKYVSAGTRFWNASGVDVSVGAGGVDVRMQSVVSLIAGGLAFETPPFLADAGPVPKDAVFTLYPDQTTAMKQPESIAARYVLYFTESLRGLSVGAPVTLLGLPGGEVTAVGLDIDPKTLAVRGRVEIVSYPERIISRLDQKDSATGAELMASLANRHALIERLIEQRGLRAQLRSGSLLTGQLYVAFDYYPNEPKVKLDLTKEVPVLPTVPSTLPDVEAKLSSIISKLDALPYDQIGRDTASALNRLDGILKDTATVLNRLDSDVTPELRGALVDARRTLATVDTTLEELRRPLGTIDAVLKNTDATILGQNAPMQQDLRDALREVAAAARSLRDLLDYLERHPDSLIRGKTEDKP